MQVDLYKSGAASETLLGIFVKSVVRNSPAGRTGQFKVRLNKNFEFELNV